MASQWLGTHRGHILVEFRGRFYGVPEALGSWDLGIAALRNNPQIVRADRSGALGATIDGIFDPDRGGAPEVPPPRRMAVDVCGHAIHFYQSRFFAIPSADGAFDPERLRSGGYGRAIVGHSLEEVKAEVERVGRLGEAIGENVLFVGAAAPLTAREFLARMPAHRVTILTVGGKPDVPGMPSIAYAARPGSPGDRIAVDAAAPGLIEELRSRSFDLVAIPFEGRRFWEGIDLEVFAAAFATRVMTLFPGGRSRLYRGEDLRRISYNKAYLNSMFRHVPPLAGKRILEVGCADGLACDLLLCEDPAEIAGVDVMDIAGCAYRDPRMRFMRIDGARLPFEDGSFDLCYSIATFEHCPDPGAVLREMRRVLVRGGHGYVQAAPLYHSPFGHHMFGYFDAYPWIHLRRSIDDVVACARERGVDAAIEQTYGKTCEAYVRGMLDPRHINGKRFRDYRLEGFCRSPDVELLALHRTCEGEALLTDDILRETSPVRREDLLGHGFELVFRKR